MSARPDHPASDPRQITVEGTASTPSSAAVNPCPEESHPKRIARFDIERFVGEGAFGRVYQAFDPSLKRTVALKVAKPEFLSSERRVERFQREARAAANLLHPHIVAVFDHGKDGPYHYIASAFVTGRPLDGVLAELPPGQTLPLTQSTQIVRHLAEALAYAHKSGVIHRDVKPANVMLRQDGEPLLMDFGLAARAEEAEKLTEAGQVLGTPAFMAPEQWHGQATAASDQYSLGCVLFELLTGQPPFDGKDAIHWLTLHTQVAAPSPRRFRPEIPRDLETICLKCLEKDPQRRYADCQALADDLRRWQEGDPVEARRPGPGERLLKWARRNPAVAALTATIFLVLLLGATVATLFGRQAEYEAGRAREQAENAEKEKGRAKEKAEEALREKKRADDLRELAERRLYASTLARAQSEWKDNNAALALELLQECQWNLRHWEHHHLWTLFNSNQRSFRDHRQEINSVNWSPDGKRIGSGSNDGTLKVWDPQTGQVILTLPGHTKSVLSVGWSPDGQRLVSTGLDRMVKVWDASSGKELRSLKGHKRNLLCVVWSPDGKRIVAGGGEWDRSQGKPFPGELKVWDAQTGRLILTLNGHQSAVTALAYSPDGKRIVSGGTKILKVWDARNGQPLATLLGHSDLVRSVAWSPDGKRIVSGSGDVWSKGKPGEVKIHDASTGQELLPLVGHTGPVRGVAWSRDGRRIVSGGDDRTLKVWDAGKGQVLFSFKGPMSISSMDWSPDGKSIVSGNWALTIWDATKAQDVLTLDGHTREIWSLAWSPDSKRIVSASWDKTLKIWDVENGRELRTLKGHGEPVSSVAWSPDGKSVVSGGYDNMLKIWDVENGRELRTLKGHTKHLLGVAWSRDGKRIASGGGDGAVKIWDAQTGRELLSLGSRGSSDSSVAWSPDGKRIAAGGGDDRVKVWDVQTGQLLLSVNHTNDIHGLAWHPDGKRIVSAGNDSTLKIWDAENGQLISTLKGHTNPVRSVVWSPDGKRIVSSSDDQTLKVWDAQAGLEVLTLKGHTDWVHGVAWSPDGTRIASGSYDNTLKIWDARQAQEVRSLIGHTGIIDCAAWNPDGTRIVSGSWDNTLKIWDVQQVRELFTLEGHTDSPLTVAWSPDGKQIASGSWDNTSKVWNSESGQVIFTLQGHKGTVNHVAYSPDGNRIVSASSDRTLKIWNAETGEEALLLEGHSGEGRTAAWSPDGKRIVSGSYDNTLKIWNVKNGQEIHILQGHTNGINSVAWSPDGKRIVSAGGSWDSRQAKPLPGQVKVWDAKTGQELLTLALPGDTWQFTSVAWSQDGTQIFAQDRTNKLLGWDALSGKLLANAPRAMPPGTPWARRSDGAFLRMEGNTLRILTPTRLEQSEKTDREWLQSLARFDPAWHHSQVKAAERSGDSFAASFHLGRLLGEYPWDASLHIRRAHALARLGRDAEALTHQMRALFLDPHVALSAP